MVVLLAGAAVAVPGPAHAALSTAGSPVAEQGRSAAATGCRARVPGNRLLPVRSGARTYRVLAYLPKGYTGRTRLPLVLNLHGSSRTGGYQQRLSETRPLADARRFITLAPDGAIPDRGGFAWNVPGVRLANGNPVPRGARDDIRFLLAAIHAAESAYCVDPRRVYLMGHSGGARMASAFACARAGSLAGLGAVGGLRAGLPDRRDPTRPDPASCRPSRPVPVISFHGTADELNPYEGGGSPYWRYPVAAAVRAWGAANSCMMSPLPVHARLHVTREFSVLCRDSGDIVSYAAHGAGHTWPGSPHNDPAPIAGPTNHEIDATSMIWSFFARHRLPD